MSVPIPHPRLAIVAAAALAAAVVGALLSPSAAADGTVMSQESLITAEATPAVQMVLAEFSATVSIPNWEIDKPAWVAEAQTATTVQEIVDAVAANPGAFFVPTAEPRTKDSTATFQGSGFVVTPDGYVVTNAHVVAPSEDSLKDQLSQGVLSDIQKEDIDSIASDTGSDTFTAGQLQQLAEAVASLDAQRMTVSNVTKRFAVAVGVGIPGLTTGAKTIPADLTVAGEEAPGKDVAILKLQSSNLITVPLGDDSGLNTADRLYVVGYPADAEISESSLTVPTLTTGAVSARKTLDNGLTVIQTDAEINHGNSGGPVLDASGKVVGIATFGRVDSATGEKVAGVNFVYPVSLIKELLSRANVTPSAGVTTTTWVAALESYNKSYFTEALPQFQAVDQLVPGAPIVQEYVTKTQRAISEGRDQTPSTIVGLPKVAFFGLVGVVLLALLAAMVMLFTRSRRSSPALAGASPSGTAGPVPPLPPPPPPVAPPTAPAATTSPPPGPPPPVEAVVTAAPVAPAPVAEPPGPAPTAPTAPPEDHPGVGRFCSNCGAAHDAEAHFCPECGHRFG